MRFGRELQIDLITGGTQSAGKNFTNAPTAPDYTAHIENVSGAGFSVSQSTPTNTKADMEIHAYNNNDNAEGAAFPGDDNDTEINITGVTFKLNGVATTAAALGITVDLNGTGLILHNVGEGVTVDFTTAGGVGETFDRFIIKNIDTEKDYFDIKEVHFSGDIPNAYNEEVGSFINFDDDGPSISTTGTEPTLTVDETLLGTNDTESFAANFSSAFGADGAGTLTYALSITAGVTGIVDTATGEAVVLSVNGSGVVEGRTATTNALVFTVSVNAAGSSPSTRSGRWSMPTPTTPTTARPWRPTIRSSSPRPSPTRTATTNRPPSTSARTLTSKTMGRASCVHRTDTGADGRRVGYHQRLGGFLGSVHGGLRKRWTGGHRRRPDLRARRSRRRHKCRQRSVRHAKRAGGASQRGRRRHSWPCRHG
ncbi:hypothetical protein AJ88_10960 [Mesorhizobium amorphae CCBAU 01583]|nr:hypothetical protein AJ88_10960 [Mesorhizobium amorphae CCBAU 01583]